MCSMCIKTISLATLAFTKSVFKVFQHQNLGLFECTILAQDERLITFVMTDGGSVRLKGI